MEARMTNPAFVVPGAMDALQALGATLQGGEVPQRTLDLVHLRASQINRCDFCMDMASCSLTSAGETGDRMFAVATWRDSALFADAERAALALTEAETRLSDRADAVSDEVWDDAARHYDERALGVLVLFIATVNLWNRLNATTRQIPTSSAAA